MKWGLKLLDIVYIELCLCILKVLYGIVDWKPYFVFVKDHLDQLLVNVGQVKRRIEWHPPGLLHLEVDVGRTLVQPDTHALLFRKENIRNNQIIGIKWEKLFILQQIRAKRGLDLRFVIEANHKPL